MQHADDTLLQRDGGKGLKIYDEIKRDTHASACLSKRSKHLVARDWEVVAASDKPIDVDAADFVRATLKDAPFDGVCENLSGGAILKGFSVSEVIWARDGNRIKPQRIVSHDQRRFAFGQDGRPRLRTWTNMHDGIELPERKFIVHRHGVVGNNPYGLGLGYSAGARFPYRSEGLRMRSFTKILPTMFDDKRWLQLDWTARTVYFYLLGGKHQTSAGAYKLPDLYAAADLHCDLKEYVKAREAITAVGLILYDVDTNELYLTDWFAENGITNEKHAVGTQRCIMQISSNMIRDAADADFQQSYQAFYERQSSKSNRPGAGWPRAV
nr:DUF935 family protein [Agrobacterium vitis]